MELSKHDKKVARRLIDKGLRQEFINGMSEFKWMLQKWDPEQEDQKTPYHAIYKAVQDFNKHIARRYDALGGGRYFYTVMMQYLDGLHNDEDLADFSPGVQEEIARFKAR